MSVSDRVGDPTQDRAPQQGFSEEMVVEQTCRIMGVLLSGLMRDWGSQES